MSEILWKINAFFAYFLYLFVKKPKILNILVKGVTTGLAHGHGICCLNKEIKWK